ncbi:polyprenyl synthetase family protein [Phycicoccus sonneratiae]|uniref:Polyprenyl synthetase family protein n=1 Tax=Phycicoccus sonneratiae TaxID=2807628 RepID=A0ABS2CHZ7_9MICO|nr:polyprenyl synthetase family protein [Phycicoccus sonneraticus]MBM6398801.1 polyprenyl synthetase family protein [Phycicoccus sonneraticus]
MTSTEPSTVSLAVLRDDPDARPLLDEVDALLEDVIGQLRGILLEVGDPSSGPGRPLAVDLVGELAERVRHHGKRLRPLFARWGWSLAGGDHATRPALVEVAAALELLQLFALVQDDVMDRSAERRGRPTLHVVTAARHRAHGGLGDADLYGDSVAVLVADLALSEATLLASRGEARVARAWRVMATELVEGQLLDVTHTAGRGRDLETSRRIARLKSGRYTITRPLQLGALVAGADTDLVTRLGAWGDLVGDAFALRDDVLGVWGDPHVTGKPAGDDLLAGKPTVLLVWAEEMLPAADRPLLEACDAGRVDDGAVAALRDAMEAAGVRRRAEDELADLVDRSHAALDDLGLDPSAREALAGLAEAVAWRSV